LKVIRDINIQTYFRADMTRSQIPKRIRNKNRNGTILREIPTALIPAVSLTKRGKAKIIDRANQIAVTIP
jgi:hypothetical protein